MMKHAPRPLPLSPRLPVLLLCVWVLCAPLPAGAAGPSASSTTPLHPAAASAPTPAPTPVLSPRAPTDSGAANASAPESRKAHPISDIFIIGPTPEPTPTPEPGPPPEGLRPPVLLPPSAGSEPGGAITLGDLATSLSLAPRPTPPPLPALTPPAIPAPAVVATPAPAATPVVGATPASVAGASAATKPAATPQGNGPVDLNSAAPAELAALPGLDINRANLIIAHRKAIGGFRQIEQLREVYGISEKILLRLMPLVAMGPYTPAPPSASLPAPAALPMPVTPLAGHARPTSATAIAVSPLPPPSFVLPESPALPYLPAPPAATPMAPMTASPLQSYASSFSTGSQPVLVIPSNLLTPARRPVSRSR